MRSLLVALFVFLAACVTIPPPTAAYSGPLVGTAKSPSDVDTYPVKPERACEDLGTVQVSCPTIANTQQGAYGGTTELLGGCSYANALVMAQEKAGDAGADAIYNVQTTSAANGKIVSLLAVVCRYKEGAATVESHDVATPSTKPSVEERLRTLQELHDKKLITDEEYQQKKADILKEI